MYIGAQSVDSGKYVKNEMSRALGYFCAHTELIGPGEPPEDGN